MAITDKVRVVIDPNIIGSVLLGGITRDRFLWLVNHLDQFELCYSDQFLAEIRHFPEVAYFKKKQITKAVIEEFLSAFQAFALKIVVTSTVKIGRDRNDYFLLSLCRDSHADYLTTGDPDLLTITSYGSTQILTLKDFVEQYQ